jgi:hypothetical protein
VQAEITHKNISMLIRKKTDVKRRSHLAEKHHSDGLIGLFMAQLTSEHSLQQEQHTGFLFLKCA